MSTPGQTPVASPLSDLLRPELQDLRPYVPHDPPGIHAKLDANEAPPTRSGEIRDAVERAVSRVALERYPDPRALRLKEAIARRTGADPACLLLGSGSDEVIGLCYTALGRARGTNPQPVVLTTTPTFMMYRFTARTHGYKPVEVALDAEWDLDLATMKRALEMMRPNVVFIASPNNPTGNRMREERLRELVQASVESLTVIDEAYVDYAGQGASLRAWRSEHPHLGFLGTLSKIGLAALRVGWLEAERSLVDEIDKVRSPFNLSSTTQAAAAAVLDEAWDAVLADVARVIAARSEVATAIEALDGFSVLPSAANFLWVKTPIPAESLYAALIGDGVLVRSFHPAGGRMTSQLRITIGTPSENDALVASLERVAKGRR